MTWVGIAGPATSHQLDSCCLATEPNKIWDDMQMHRTDGPTGFWTAENALKPWPSVMRPEKAAQDCNATRAFLEQESCWGACMLNSHPEGDADQTQPCFNIPGMQAGHNLRSTRVQATRGAAESQPRSGAPEPSQTTARRSGSGCARMERARTGPEAPMQ